MAKTAVKMMGLDVTATRFDTPKSEADLLVERFSVRTNRHAIEFSGTVTPHTKLALLMVLSQWQSLGGAYKLTLNVYKEKVVVLDKSGMELFTMSFPKVKLAQPKQEAPLA